jgi:hypothetical protein
VSSWSLSENRFRDTVALLQQTGAHLFTPLWFAGGDCPTAAKSFSFHGHWGLLLMDGKRCCVRACVQEMPLCKHHKHKRGAHTRTYAFLLFLLKKPGTGQKRWNTLAVSSLRRIVRRRCNRALLEDVGRGCARCLIDRRHVVLVLERPVRSQAQEESDRRQLAGPRRNVERRVTVDVLFSWCLGQSGVSDETQRWN